jgi:hypothetical protein
MPSLRRSRFPMPLLYSLAIGASGCAVSDPIDIPILLPDAGSGLGGGGDTGSGGIAGGGSGVAGADGTGTAGTFGTTGAAGTFGTTGTAGTFGMTGTAGAFGTGGAVGGSSGQAGRGGSGGRGGADGRGSGGTTGGGGTTGAGLDAAAAPTFTEIYNTILTAHCFGSSCHSPGSAGNVSFASQASAYSAVKSRVTAGNGAGSNFYATVNNGVMPPGGPKLSAANLALIKAWIDAGALND